MSRAVKLRDIELARERIKDFVHKTPVLTCSTLDKMAATNLFFKCENLQKTGAFKARGACNAVLIEKESGNTSGVVTHSSGNHGQALAYAAMRMGLPCSVVVPKGTPKIKCDAIQSYGAKLVFCEPTPTARKETCAQIAADTGYGVVHPYDDLRVIAGQGTMALEILEQVKDLDAILVPISGGGMTSGIAIAAKSMNPQIKVFAVEPKGKLLGESLQAKERLWEGPPKFIDTVADSIRIQQVGDLTFPILCEFAESEVFTVNDEQMIYAMQLVWERMKMVVETASGAAVYAAIKLLPQKYPNLKNVAVILCGGNVDLRNLPWINYTTSYKE